VNHLKQCAIAHANRNQANDSGLLKKSQQFPAPARPKVDKSVLTIGEPKRIRDREHLRFVATQPCLICGRSPSHAHHVRCAQSRGLSLKVSDEFTVPLCAIHHHQIHTSGKEREWWQERNVDPLKVAAELWLQSRKQQTNSIKAELSASLELGSKLAPAEGASSDKGGDGVGS
jgi:hypothetical protein